MVHSLVYYCNSLLWFTCIHCSGFPIGRSLASFYLTAHRQHEVMRLAAYMGSMLACQQPQSQQQLSFQQQQEQRRQLQEVEMISAMPSRKQLACHGKLMVKLAATCEALISAVFPGLGAGAGAVGLGQVAAGLGLQGMHTPSTAVAQQAASTEATLAQTAAALAQISAAGPALTSTLSALLAAAAAAGESGSGAGAGANAGAGGMSALEAFVPEATAAMQVRWGL